MFKKIIICILCSMMLINLPGLELYAKESETDIQVEMETQTELEQNTVTVETPMIEITPNIEEKSIVEDNSNIDVSLNEEETIKEQIVIPSIGTIDLNDVITPQLTDSMYDASISFVAAHASGDIYYKDLKIWFNPRTGYISEADTDIVTLNIPAQLDGVAVIGIGNRAFVNIDTLTKVVLPDGIKTIESYAFDGCDNLTNVNFPNTLESIGEYAFRHCNALTEVKLLKGIKNIYRFAFDGCANITKVTLPEGIEFMGDSIFAYNGNLAEVNLPNDLEIITDRMFDNCDSLTTITLPQNVKAIGYTSFKDCDTLTKVVLPEGIKTIGNYAFDSCDKLKNVNFPNTLESIGEYAFRHCNALTEVHLLKGIKTISSFAFDGCENITKVTLPEGIEFMGDSIFTYNAKLSEVNLPNDLEIITDRMFENCDSLTTITLPQSVKIIGNKSFTDCDTLTKVVLPEGIKTIGNYAFDSCDKLKNVNFPNTLESIGECAFRHCNGLTDITLPGSLETIGHSVFFQCNELTSVILPKRLKSIGHCTFENCTKLKTVVFPSELESTGDYTFKNCSELSNITLPDKLKAIGYGLFEGTKIQSIILPSELESIGNYAFKNCTQLKTIDFPESVKNIGSEAFFGCVNFESVVLPEDIKTIGDGAFANNSKLVEVKLPLNLEKISSSIFENCSALTTTVLPENIKSIDSFAFKNCTALSDLSFPEGIEAIGDEAFKECNNLTINKFPEELKYLGLNSFYGCKWPEIIVIPPKLETIPSRFIAGAPIKEVIMGDSVKTIKDSAFANCWVLEKVKLNEGLQNIHRQAFYGCSSLKEVNLPDSLGGLGFDAFYGCSSLKEITIPKNISEIYGYSFGGLDIITLPENLTRLTTEIYGINFFFSEHTLFRVKEGSKAEKAVAEKGYNYIYYFEENSLELEIYDENKKQIASGYDVVWYEKGSNTPIANGNFISVSDMNIQYEYEVKLHSDLENLYIQPNRQEVIYNKRDIGYVCELTLVPRQNCVIKGKVTNQTGSPVENAVLIFEQSLQDDRKQIITTTTDQNGDYTITLQKFPTMLSLYKDGYQPIDFGEVVLENETCNLSTIQLKQIELAQIELHLEKILPSEKIGNGKIEKMTSTSNISFELYNETQGRDILDYMIQYPFIYINSDEVNEGDMITIDASDDKGTLANASTTITFNQEKNANATLSFMTLGSFKVNVKRNSIIYVFDSLGKFVEKYTGNDVIESNCLKEGSYSIVMMHNKLSLKGINSIDALNTYELQNQKDYLLEKIQINDGIITDLGMRTVPIFTKNLSLYMEKDKTRCVSSKTEMVVGNLLSVKTTYEILNEYNTSNETVVFDVPENVTIVPGSLTVDGVGTNFIMSDNKLELKVNRKSGVIKFYISPNKPGLISLNSCIYFDCYGKSVVQHVGALDISVIDINLIAPTFTGFKSVLVHGKALPESEVKVYCNNILVAKSSVNKIGNWSAKVDLVNPGEHSKHNIYAEFTNYYGITYRSQVHNLTYDKNYSDLESIRLINASTLNIDFREMNQSNLSYTYNSSLYTFIVKFSGENVTNVKLALIVGGDTIYVPCEYDAENQCYIGNYSGGIVTGVSAIYDMKVKDGKTTFKGNTGSTSGTNYSYEPQINRSAYEEPNLAMEYGITDVFPKKASNGHVTLMLDGKLFEANTEVYLSNTTESIKSEKVYWVNHQTVYAQFNLTQASDGVYNVEARCGEQTHTLNKCFTVDSSLIEGKSKITLKMANEVQKEQINKGYIAVKNEGYTDIYAPVMNVKGKNILFSFIKGEDVSMYQQESKIFVQNHEGLAGVIGPGETAHINFSYSVLEDGEYTLELEDYSEIKGELFKQIQINENSTVSDILTANMISLHGSTYEEYTKSMSEMANKINTVYNDTEINFELLEVIYKNFVEYGNGGSDTINITDVSSTKLTINRTFTNSLVNKHQTGVFGLGWNSIIDKQILRSKSEDAEILSYTDGEYVSLYMYDKEKDVFVNVFNESTLATINEEGKFIITYKDGSIETFNKDGRIESITDSYNNSVEYKYKDNQLIEISSSTGDVLSLSYNENKKISKIISNVTNDFAEYHYKNDYLVAVTTPFGTERYEYDADSIGGKRNTLTSIIYPDGTREDIAYDEYGRIQSISDKTGVTTYEYDLLEMITKDSEGNSTITTYDVFGNILRSRDALGQNYYYKYDGVENVEKQTIGLLNGVKIYYNDNLMPIKVVGLNGNSVSFKYDQFGNITSIEDSLQNTVKYRRDEKGKLTSIVYPNYKKESVIYDENGNISEITDCNGIKTIYQYNPKHDIEKIEYSTGNSIAYEYDDRGNLVSIIEDEKETSMTYDERNLLTKILYPSGKTVSYEYDNLGRKVAVIDSENVKTFYEYDDLGNLSTVYNGETKVVSYTYNKDLMISKKENGNGTYATYEYKNNQIDKILYYNQNNELTSQFIYTYNKDGYIEKLETNEGLYQYTYDLEGNLIKVVNPNGKIDTYTYDAAGNRQTTNVKGVNNSYTTNNMNQYTALSTSNIRREYDDAGQLIKELSDSGITQYEWNHKGQLVKVTTSDNHVYEYEYDVFGGRSKVIKDGVETEYVNDPSGYSLTSYTQGKVTRYVLANGIESSVNDYEYYYYEANHLGSITGITTETGEIVNRYVYDAEGNVISKEEQITNPFTYIGKYGVMDDGNDLLYDRARYVSKSSDSFISMDPTGQFYDINMYRFVTNNPVNYVDLSGKASMDDEKAALAWQKYIEAIERGENPEIPDELEKYMNKDNKNQVDLSIEKSTNALGENDNKPKDIDVHNKNQSISTNKMVHKTHTSPNTVMKNNIFRRFKSGRVVSEVLVIALAFIPLGFGVSIAIRGIMFALKVWDIISIMQLLNDCINFIRDNKDKFKMLFKPLNYSIPGTIFPPVGGLLENSSVNYNLTAKIDPSGYVYEGVTSNRLEGVKAVVYYEDYPLDEFGQKDEDAGLQAIEWTDASDYGEVNPQYTNENGEYGWDVPQGRWKVKFSKVGYEDYWTDWMDVPPEYSDVNINLKNLQKPVLKSVNAYRNCVQLIFSQYMNIKSISADTFIVKINGVPVEGVIKPKDIGYDFTQENQYARIFEFIPNESISNKVNVSVNGVNSYANQTMDSFTKDVLVVEQPTEITIVMNEEMKLNSSTVMTLDVLPKGTANYRGVKIIAKNPDIADVSYHTFNLDKNGHGEVVVNAKASGMATFEVEIVGTTLKSSFTTMVLGIDGKNPYISNIDKNSLIELVNEIRVFIDNNKKDDYTKASWNTLEYALNAALGEAESDVSTQESIDIVENNLLVAFDGLVDRTPIVEPLERARAILEDQNTNNTYTTESFIGFYIEYEALVMLYQQETAYSKEDIELALNRFEISLDGLEKRTKPNVVRNLKVKQESYKVVKLNWDKLDNAESYDVYVKGYKTNSEFELKSTVDTNEAIISGLMTGKTYSFYVVARNDVGDSDASEVVTFATILTGEVTLEMKKVSTSKFKLSWNKVDGATRYIVYRKRNEDTFKKVLTLAGNVFTYTTAEMPHGDYKFIVKAGRYDSVDRVMTDSSNTVYGKVDETKPVIKLVAGNNQVKVSWEKVEGVTHYEVYSSTGNKYKKLKTTTSTTYIAKSLTKGKKYYFKVRGYKTYKSGTEISYKVYTSYSSAKNITTK